MVGKFFYGSQPKFTEKDKKRFSRGSFECIELLKDSKGDPVVVSKSKNPDYPLWRVEYGFSCVIFKTYDEAKAFCKERFAG